MLNLLNSARSRAEKKIKGNYLTLYALGTGQTVGWCLSVSVAFIVVFLIIRQEAQEQPTTCPADREGLDRDRVNNLFLRSSMLTFRR